MNAAQIRSSFLSFFQKNGHQLVDSSALVPQSDPTLLFTNAGMVQFKDVFTGREKRDYKRATTSQKCVRAGGKHNDLENVGRTARHHTFFEMLGNFSFGDYFKEGAIDFAWTWLTKELALDPKRLCITVFGGDAGLQLGPDDEARALWKKRTGYGDDRILGMGMADNFWMMGDTGPQGPCSEIHYFIGDGAADIAQFGTEPSPDGRGWMEIWNLVFMQFERKTKGAPLQPLPKPSIDTGAGLERVAAVVEGKSSNYDTSLLRPLVDFVAGATGKRYGASMAEDDVSMRVLADHARATAFLIGDGVTPSNEGRGYVLRRIMRRAIRHGVRIGLDSSGWSRLIEQVGVVMGDAYPELRERRATIDQFATAEDAAFRRTLDRGLKLLDEEFTALKSKGDKTLPGEVVFKLYDTFGFPADLTRVIAEERGATVDEAGFDREMDKQRARSEDFGGSGEQAVADLWKQVRSELGATTFLGYEVTEADGEITWLGKGGAAAAEARAGDAVAIVARKTPFYGESGGQIGDTGKITGSGNAFVIEVTETLKPGGDLIVHQGKVLEGAVKRGAAARFVVDVERRDAIRANHSATHLLHLALKDVLGDHVAQKGSLVAPDRLRFDFSHFGPVTDEQKQRIEDWVNQEVRANLESQTAVKSFDEARKMGAVALFGEKYGSEVRVLRIGSRSMELCGGTHVRRTGDIGLFKITQELGIAQGIRRLEAVTGKGALEYVRQVEGELQRAALAIRAAPTAVADAVVRLQKELKERERKIEDLQRKMALGGAAGAGGDLMSQVKETNGIKVLSARTTVSDPKALREVADQLRNKMGSGLVVLGGADGDKVSLVAAVTADLVGRLHAGKIIADVAKQVGGKGGGRPDLAQAGGSDASKLDEALASVYALVV